METVFTIWKMAMGTVLIGVMIYFLFTATKKLDK